MPIAPIRHSLVSLRAIVPDDAFGRKVIEATAALADRLSIGPWNGEREAFMGPLISARAATPRARRPRPRAVSASAL